MVKRYYIPNPEHPHYEYFDEVNVDLFKRLLDINTILNKFYFLIDLQNNCFKAFSQLFLYIKKSETNDISPNPSDYLYHLTNYLGQVFTLKEFYRNSKLLKKRDYPEKYYKAYNAYRMTLEYRDSMIHDYIIPTEFLSSFKNIELPYYAALVDLNNLINQLEISHRTHAHEFSQKLKYHRDSIENNLIIKLGNIYFLDISQLAKCCQLEIMDLNNKVNIWIIETKVIPAIDELLSSMISRSTSNYKYYFYTSLENIKQKESISPNEILESFLTFSLENLDHSLSSKLEKYIKEKNYTFLCESK